MGERRSVERKGTRKSRKAGTPPSSLVEQSRHQGEGQGLEQERQELGRKGKVERGRGKVRWKIGEGEEHFFDQEIRSSR